MKVDYLIMNGEKKNFFPTIAKTGSRNTKQEKYYKNRYCHFFNNKALKINISNKT